MKEARFYEALDDGKVRCGLCPHRCVIADGKAGFCRIRKNNGGKLWASTYGEVASMAMDPIEKKPLYHFHPGAQILSIGTHGCNFHCPFCQNWEISQRDGPRREASPAQLVEIARQNGSIGIAYTYNEPMIWFEFVMDAGRLFREAGMVNALVTNGYVNPEPLAEMLTLVDALNVDIKSMRPEFYKDMCKGELAPVLETCKTAAKTAHLEITNLVIPGQNDEDEDFHRLARWIAEEIGDYIPLHLSAYSPRHQFDAPPTGAPRLTSALDICRQYLKWVYVGNLRTSRGSNSYCPNCKAMLVERYGYCTVIQNLAGDKCAQCGAQQYFRQ